MLAPKHPSTVARRHLEKVTRCAARVAKAQDDLRQAIVEANLPGGQGGGGETLRDIATAAGLSHQRVWQIINEYRRSQE